MKSVVSQTGFEFWKKNKLWIALALFLWIFLIVTTFSWSYSWAVRNNIDLSTNFWIIRAVFIWTVIALLFPVYIYAAKKFYVKGNSVVTIALHVLNSIFLIFICSVIYRAILMVIWYTDTPFNWENFWHVMPIVITQFAITAPLSYGLIVAGWYLKKYYDQFKKRQVDRMEMEARLSAVRLGILKVQLHPHFLFNSLHNVHTLLHENINKANHMLSLLKRFLRISITRAKDHTVPLVDELEFTGAYLEIEKIRFSNRLKVQTDIQKEILQAMVPSFLLQPLVENAIQHGISKKASAGIIRITARKKEGNIIITVEDNGPGLVNSNTSRGLGIPNIKQRLNYLYENHIFNLKQSGLGGLKVYIELPLSQKIIS